MMYTTQGAGGGGSLDSELYSTSPHTKSLPQPIGRPERTGSASSDSFQRAVGAEVKSKSLEDEGEVCTYHMSDLLPHIEPRYSL